MARQLEKSILATIAYFDVFDYPLTLLELRRLLLGRTKVSYALSDIQRVLDEGALLQKAVRRKNGFFYVRGRDANVSERRGRFLISQEKHKGSRFVLHLLSYMPFVRALFICNSLALENTTHQSDVDVVVVAKTGGVWWARLFSLVLLSLLRRRPGQAGGRPKICLSFFIDEAHLDVRTLRMSGNDIDFAYWIAHFYPIYDTGNAYLRFWAANYPWLSEVLPNARPIVPHPERVMRHGILLRPLFEALLAPFSPLARAIQEKRFPPAIKEIANHDTRVRIGDGVLKFHTNDRRVAHMESFIKRYEALLSL
ncbi:MAG: hypothetical protein HYT31_04445 [Parcubacteria group bacterium]|nr:hypothetical protein [Parcubacteria group bacterium]